MLLWNNEEKVKKGHSLRLDYLTFYSMLNKISPSLEEHAISKIVVECEREIPSYNLDIGEHPVLLLVATKN